MSRLEANKVVLDITRTLIRNVIDLALKNSRNAFGKRSITVRVPSDIPPVPMDESRIREELMHLTENAAKYSPADASIHIAVALRSRQLTVSVADRGPWHRRLRAVIDLR